MSNRYLSNRLLHIIGGEEEIAQNFRGRRR